MKVTKTAAFVPASTGRDKGANVIRDLNGFDGIEAEWTAMAARQPWAGPMQHHSWARCWLQAGEPEPAPAIVMVGGAIAPLARPGGWGRPLELVGQAALQEPMDFLYRDPDALRLLADALVRLRLPLRLDRVRADSPTLAALAAAYRGKGGLVVRPAAECPWIALDDSWQEPERHVNAGRRSDLRRARRIAAGMGPVAAEILTPDPATLDRHLDEFLRVEAAGWKGRGGTALAHDARRGAFYRRFADEACRRGQLRLGILRIGEQVAAAQFAIATGGRFWLLKIGYADQFARCSPGLLLLLESIGHAARAGLQSFEFLGTSEPWIRTWAAQAHACVSVRAYPCGLAGGAAFLRDAVAALRRRR